MAGCLIGIFEAGGRPHSPGIVAPWHTVHIEGFFRRSAFGSKPGPCGLKRRPPWAEWQVRQSRSE